MSPLKIEKSYDPILGKNPEVTDGQIDKPEIIEFYVLMYSIYLLVGE